MRGKIVNKAELAAILGRSAQSLTAWQAEGMPYVKSEEKGGDNAYNTAEIIAWIIRRETSDGLDLNAERAKLAKEQTESSRLKNEERRGELIPLPAVIEIAQRAAHAIRQKIVGCSMTEDEKNVLLTDINSLANADYTNFKKIDEQDDEPDATEKPDAPPGN